MQNIFRYSPNCEKCVNTLINNQLYFSDPNNFNDIFDGKADLVNVKFEKKEDIVRYRERLIELHRKDSNKELERISDSELEDLAVMQYKKLLRERMNDIRVCCFSRSLTNNVMWHNYANKHIGFVTEFDNGILNDKGMDVIYRKDFPFLTPIEIEKQNPIILNTIFKYKSQEWSHEEEIRLLTSRGNELSFYNPNLVKGIYFGINSTEDMRNFIMDKLTTSFKKDVDFYMMKKAEYSYTLDFELI